MTMEQPPKVGGNDEDKKEMTKERDDEIEELFKKLSDTHPELWDWLHRTIGSMLPASGDIELDGGKEKKLLEISSATGIPTDEIEDYWDRYHYPDESKYG